MSTSTTASAKTRVGFQGMSGCYSEGAAVDLFGSQPYFKNVSFETLPFPTFPALFEALEKDQVESAIVPIENTHSGTLHNVYDLLTKSQVYITGEYIYHEQHCLLAFPGVKVSDVTEVRTHPHVLDQCSLYLGKLGNGVTRSQAEDTASSASYVKTSQSKTTAAIAGKRAAQIYGLDVLAEEIEDDKSCATRYLLLSKKPVVPERHTSPKTSIVISLKNAPGHLYKALSCFALRDINVSKIESRPSARSGSMISTSRPWEYLMYVDVEGSVGDIALKNAIRNMEEFATAVRVLGSYPRFQPVMKTSSLGPFGM